MTGLDLSAVAKALQGSERRNRAGSGIQERHALRLGRQSSLRRNGIFRKCSATGTEHCIAGLELRNAGTDSFNDAGNIDSGPLEFAAAKQQTSEGRPAFHQVKVQGVDSSGADLDQDFSVAWGWFVKLLAGQDFRRTIFAIHDGFHAASFSTLPLESRAQNSASAHITTGGDNSLG